MLYIYKEIHKKGNANGWKIYEKLFVKGAKSH